MCTVVYMNMLLCADTPGGQKLTPDIFPNCFSTLLFDAGSLSEPRVLDFGWTGWPLNL